MGFDGRRTGHHRCGDLVVVIAFDHQGQHLALTRYIRSWPGNSGWEAAWTSGWVTSGDSVERGGSWLDRHANVRAVSRLGSNPFNHNYFGRFRVVMLPI